LKSTYQGITFNLSLLVATIMEIGNNTLV